MKYSRLRTALLTFIIGFFSVSFLTPFFDKWREPSVNLPKVLSDSVIVVELETENRRFDRGGGGSGGQTCEDFIKSLGKLTKQSRRILAYTPCFKVTPKE